MENLTRLWSLSLLLCAVAACTPISQAAPFDAGLRDVASPDAVASDAQAHDLAVSDTGQADLPAPDAVMGADRVAAFDSTVALDASTPPDSATVVDVAQADPGPQLCTGDSDQDGYGPGSACLGLDCSPANPGIHPGAAELCDQVDNDCDGLVDEELSCPALPSKIWVFILAGQSNMVGLGLVSELNANQDLFPAALRSGIPKVGIYLEDSVHTNPNQNGAMRWLDLSTYGGFGVDQAHFGPELGFGKRMHELWPDRQIRILKVAEGATDLDEDWAARSGRLYDLLVNTVQGQFATLGEHERIELVGLVWMQGESDAYGDLADAYYLNLKRFIGALREDLSQPLLPVCAALIAPQGGWPDAEAVRDATAELADDLGPMSTVETNDLPMWPNDVAHYNTRSQLLLGQRFADAIAGLLPTAWHFGEDFSQAQGDAQWLYRAREPGGAVEELSYFSWLQRWGGSETGLAIARGTMSPGATTAAELSWRAPYGGRVVLDLTVRASGGAGGDGTWVELADGDFVRWGPVPLTGSSSGQHHVVLDVVQGRELMFRTAAGPAQDASGDSTSWDIDLVMSEVDE